MKSNRQQIIESINSLIEIREIIFEQIVNIAMSSEYKDLDTVFDEGDHYTFSIKQFEDLKDVNVQKFIKHFKKTDKLIATLLNINAIDEEELNDNED